MIMLCMQQIGPILGGFFGGDATVLAAEERTGAPSHASAILSAPGDSWLRMLMSDRQEWMCSDVAIGGRSERPQARALPHQCDGRTRVTPER